MSIIVDEKDWNEDDLEYLYAYMSVDDKGLAGFCAAMTPIGMTQMVSATREGIGRYDEYVDEMRKHTDKKIVLVRYKVDAVIG